MSSRELLVFGDVHADFDALGRVFDLAEERGCEHWICLGDGVGYGDSPAETVAQLRSREGQILRGKQ
jgi:predicted phosphodiesterase